ncbi:hypothetical protein L7F22_066639 [Adiantum nelumboides]|nr:hypothetical protein [Adiantum nelumboides]
MALQLAFRPGDGEDVNSFDQLADDLGQRSDGLLRNLEKRKEEEQEKGQEATCLEEALSKLCRSDHGAAAETFLSGDENWMQGRVPNKNLYANPAVASITGLISAPRETSEADTAKSLHGVCSGIGEDMNCKVSLGMSSLDGNADVGTPRVSPLEEGDPQGSELATSSLARSQSLQTNALAPASFQPVVKELLWSTFSESYTPSDGSNVLNDFLAELDAGSSELHDRQSGACNTSSLSKWKIESGSFTDQNITNSCHFGTDASSTSQLHEEHGMHCHLKTRQSQLESDSPVFSSFHGTSEQPSGDSNVGQVENEIGLTFEGGHNVRMHFQGDHNVVYEGKQSLMSLQCSSLVDAQLGASYTDQYSVKADQNVYSSHQQISTSQSWESMYPGWYFDYSKNEWKQIEGWDISTYSMTNEHPVSGSTAVTDDYSTSNTATATLSQLNIIQGAGTMPSHLEFKERQNHIAGNNNTADVSGTLAQEQVIFTGSAWPTKEASVSTSLGSLLKGEETNLTDESEQRNIDGALQSQMQVSWEEQYPGWYFEYGVQQWCPVIAGTSVVNNGGNIEPSLSQENLLMKPEHQLNENWSVVQPVGGDGSHDRDANNLVVSNQNLSFHAWGPSVVTTHWSDPVNEKTGTVKEAFLAEGNGLSFGTQSYSSGAIQHFKEMETPFDNSYGLHSYNQSHSFYGAAKETKFTSDERPAHALVAFGFGGKLVTMKAATNSIPCLVVLHDLNQLIEASADNNRNDYFSSLNRGGLAGPLLGSGVAIKEVLKWVDDRIANCEMEDPHRTESLRILWGVLRIACMHYGKVRPTHGSSNAKSLSEEGPELDLGRLLSSSCGGFQNCNFSATSAGLQVTPPETQFQSIALEMRKRLIEGKRKEALHLAQQGQLWGPALVLASYLGEKAYAETVLQMSKQQFVPGCPLRTLFLLLGGQTGELFTALSLPSPGGTTATMKDSAGGMLSDWMGNLSIIAANPTNGDEQVITHLGDCLWKDHGEVFGAHTCYLVADATFESFSENARLCLVGADHFKWQRTFATPMSIQVLYGAKFFHV